MPVEGVEEAEGLTRVGVTTGGMGWSSGDRKVKRVSSEPLAKSEGLI